MEITLRPTIKQHEAYEALKTKNTVFFGGGAGGGKSWWLCESRLINCYLHPGYKSFIGREELKRLMQSTYVTWSKVCAFHKIPKGDWKLNGHYNYIEFKNGSRIDLLDLKYIPSDPLYERLGSLEFTDGAIEEAGEVHALAYDVLKSRIGRHINKENKIKPTMAITGNPKKNWTYKEFYKPSRDGTLQEDYAFIQSLYLDNPHTAEGYKKQLSQITDKATKERLMFGNWEYDDDPAKMIEYDAIVDMFTNTIEENNEMYLTADIARYGKDKTVIMIWRGYEVIKIIIIDKSGIDIVQQKISGLLEDYKIPRSRAIIDDDGVGGGVVDNLRGVKGFVNNSSPIEVNGEKQNYKNLKTQCYYILANKINDRRIAVKEISETTKNLLIEELEQVKTKDIDKDSKLQIIPKEEVKELIGRSPDYSDTLMMRMFFDLKPAIRSNVKVILPKFNQLRY